MPAKDKYHDAVVNALEKEGWDVASQSYLRVGKRVVWVDLKARRRDGNSFIMIEIKGFENMASPVDYVAHAVGKYVLYRAILDSEGDTTPLYLAVPLQAYQGILDEDIGRILIEHVKIKLVVFIPENEEIIEWIE